ELGEAVRKGRREEFSRFKGFTGELPDPLAESTFQACVLDWAKADHVWLAHYKHLLSLRQSHVVPLDCGPGRYRMLGERAFEVTWGRLVLIANCGDVPVQVKDTPSSKPLWTNGAPGAAWSVNWWLNSDPGS
ncbi:MAG TPA: DUF3459 domain-containing protein, partial [Burkholderiales bacterium]|nr:DUF3459 domain-containing protein [Burkholderiales bacterium]